jgi:hypothetical protein
MELGQIFHNNPVGIELPEYVRALVFHVRREIARVYWNVNHRCWAEDPSTNSFLTEGLNYDTGIPGVEWRAYYNWGGCPDDPDWNQDEADKPNFRFEDIEIRWYKRFGRSMNVNAEKSPSEWVAWFDRCFDAILVYENRMHEISWKQAAERGNAPRDCRTCHKVFNWPADRCGYCGQQLSEHQQYREQGGCHGNV